MANINREISSIECDIIQNEVVSLDEERSQQRGRVGLAVTLTRSLLEGIPEDCPLTFPAAHRKLGNYAACLTCDHSDATAATIIAEPSRM